MPTVPLVSDGGQPQRSAFPGVRLSARTSPDTYGVPIARGVDNVAAVGLDIYAKERAKADQVRMLDIDRQLGEWENAKLYDPKIGAFNTRGEKAFGLTESVPSDFDSFSSGLSEGLSDQQKIAAQGLIQNRRQAIERSVQNHVAGERRTVEDTAFKGVIDTSQSAAVANYGDPSRVETEVGRQQDAIEQMAQRNGLPPEWTQSTMENATSRTYSGVIGRMIDRGDDLAAKDAYARWGEGMTGEDRGHIEKALEIGSTRAESQRQADSIFSAAKSEDDALDSVRKITDAKLRDETHDRVLQLYSDQHTALKSAESDAFDQGYQALVAPGNAKGLDAIPPSTAAAMGAENWSRLESMGKREVPEFSQDLSDLQRMVGTPAFEHVNLVDYRGKVRDAQLAELQKVQQEQAQKGASGPKVAGIMGDNDIVANSIQNLGIKPNSDADIRFQSAYKDAIIRQTAANGGKPLLDDDKVAIARQLAADHVATVTRGWYNPARWFGSSTTQGTDGNLYTRPADEIANGLPIPGTGSRATGEGMSASDVRTWVDAITSGNEQTKAAIKAKLKRMAHGLREDGTYDPALQSRYQIIKQSVRTAQAAP